MATAAFPADDGETAVFSERCCLRADVFLARAAFACSSLEVGQTEFSSAIFQNLARRLLFSERLGQLIAKGGVRQSQTLKGRLQLDQNSPQLVRARQNISSLQVLNCCASIVSRPCRH